MSKKIQSLVIVSLLIFYSPFVLSTSWSSDYSFYVKVHFSKFYYDKEVESVTAHIGVLTRPNWMCGSGDRCKKYWALVSDLPLTFDDGDFTGRIILKGESGKWQPTSLGPIVQYWVKFKDGSELITDDFLIERTESELDDYTEDSGDYDDFQEKFKKEFYESPVEKTEYTQVMLRTIS